MQLQSLLSFVATPAPGIGTGQTGAANPAGPFGFMVEGMVRSLGAAAPTKPTGTVPKVGAATAGPSTDDAVLAGLMQAMGMVAPPTMPVPPASDLQVSLPVAFVPDGGGVKAPPAGSGDAVAGAVQPGLQPVPALTQSDMPDGTEIPGALPGTTSIRPDGSVPNMVGPVGSDVPDVITATPPDTAIGPWLPAMAVAENMPTPKVALPPPMADISPLDAISQPIIVSPANEQAADMQAGPDGGETRQSQHAAVAAGARSPKPTIPAEFSAPDIRPVSGERASVGAETPTVAPAPAPSGGPPPLTTATTVSDATQVVPRDQVAHAVIASRHAIGAQGSAGLQLVGRIEQAVAKEQTTLTVQLDPEHLGRVEVKLELQDGRVTAMIAAEKPATLDLLQRDARLIERTLQQGGMQVQPDGLHFSLREGGGQWTLPEQGRRGAQLYGQQAQAEPRPDPLTPVLFRTDSLVDIQI